MNTQSARAILDALIALADRIDAVTKNAGYGSGMFEPEMAAARAAIRAARASDRQT